MSIVCDISAAARDGCRAKKGLPNLIRLRKRAQDSLVAANKPKMPSAFAGGSPPEEDDLSHLISTAKLRRLGSSPPQQKVALGETAPRQTQPGESGISPHSQGSFATSTTLAEPHYYDDTNQYLVDPDQPQYAGVVPAPPDQMIPDGMCFKADLSPQVALDLSASYPWPAYDEGLMGGSSGQGVMDMDMSMALGLGGSTDMGMGTGVDQEDGAFGFDFEAFVNQAGVDGSFVGEEGWLATIGTPER